MEVGTGGRLSRDPCSNREARTELYTACPLCISAVPLELASCSTQCEITKLQAHKWTVCLLVKDTSQRANRRNCSRPRWLHLEVRFRARRQQNATYLSAVSYEAIIIRTRGNRTGTLWSVGAGNNVDGRSIESCSNRQPYTLGFGIGDWVEDMSFSMYIVERCLQKPLGT